MPPSSFALASPPSTSLRTVSSSVGEVSVYLILSTPPGNTYHHSNTTSPLPPPTPSPASAVVGNDYAGTDANGNIGNENGGELTKAAGIGIEPFPPLLIPESALPMLSLHLSLPLLPIPPSSLSLPSSPMFPSFSFSLLLSLQMLPPPPPDLPLC